MESSLILGFFDGVHLGHQAVLSSALDFACLNGTKTILVTFKNSPACYFNNNVKYILSRENSIRKIKTFGISEVVELDFQNIAHCSASNYLEFLVKEFSPKSISTGFNHTFGFNKSGNVEFLAQNQQKYNYQYFCVQKQEYKGNTISSTYIKELLQGGNIIDANILLNEPFLINGVVKKGAQLGRKIGFPTINIDYPENIIQIPYGVYVAKVNDMPSVLNWGVKPTVNNELKPVVETHILNFDKNLYGENVKIQIIDRIRDEKKFSSLSELQSQIKKDIKKCLELL